MELTTDQSGHEIKKDTTRRCSDSLKGESEHLLVVSDPDLIPYNGVSYRISPSVCPQGGLM